MKTEIYLTIVGLKELFHSSETSVTFNGDLEDFEIKVDKIIDELGFKKADVHINNSEVFSEEEINTLEEMGFSC